MDLRSLDHAENRRRMLAGELYYAFTPDLTASRERCKAACTEYNLHVTSGVTPRRKLVELWQKFVELCWALPCGDADMMR